MLSRFFINRPIFATVLSVVITLTGAIALLSLPVAQYPPITPPAVQVSCSYPGASAQVVADTVAAPIEQQVNGVEGMLYMSSQAGNDGSYTLTVTFELGADLNTALVMVQNRVALANPQLPTPVQKQGLTVKKKNPDLLMIVNFLSPDGRYDDLYLSNFATINVRDELFRIEGVSDITYLGQRDYSMRVWLDPQALASRGITAAELAAAVRDQNVELAGGRVGQPPVDPSQAFELPVDALGRLRDPDQYGAIVVRAARAGDQSVSTGLVRLRDVARVELGAQNYNQACTFDGRPSVGLAVRQLPGTNALDVADRVRLKMEELEPGFPDGVEYRIAYDTTPFIRESVADVVRTFAVMAALGFSLNNISLFGLVLAIGIVVDDAIVVVENVERWLEHGLPPREAARKAMDEVTGPVIAVALVLCAVFVPCAFIGGITGEFFRQFAVTIAVSTAFSAFNSLTLSPALAAILLRPRGAARDPLTRLLDLFLGWFFRLFNAAFGFGTEVYTRLVAALLRVSVLALLVYGELLALTYWEFERVPWGFIPQQDKGYLLLNVQLPDSASVERTRRLMARIEAVCLQTPGVQHTVGISGRSLILNASAPNLGSMYVMLKPFAQRRGPGLTAAAIGDALRDRCRRAVRGAVVSVFGAPPVEGLGTTGGFKLVIEDRGGLGLGALQSVSDWIVARGNETPGLRGLFNSSRSDTPWLYLDIDRDKSMTLGVPLSEVFGALEVFLGSYYVNNFNQFGRTWQVNVQADERFRNRVRNIREYQVRTAGGEMLPMSTLFDMRHTSGPVMVMRYNMYTAAAVTGDTAPGTSSGQAVALMESIARAALPSSMAYNWTELTYAQLQAGGTAIYVFGLAVVFVFLVLAAQYESWRMPLAVILVVPLCLLCSVVGVDLARTDITVFTQIGFVVLVGLASKNAILIVEFAKQRQEAGVPRREATIEASRLRLRPILMTSFAFILGVVPLVVAQGAGAEMRRNLGVAVFSGMLGVTFFGIFLTPVFYYVIQWFGDRGPRPATETAGKGEEGRHGGGVAN
jgi:multidrug efflux pump subunit AcrB